MNSNESNSKVHSDKTKTSVKALGSHLCTSCHATLVTRGIPPGRLVRCGRCGEVSQHGEAIEAVDQNAWRSFWLGLASILLLSITGIPAVYYGVRSLLKMKYVRPNPGDRRAAVAGTMLGGCLGLIVGPFFVLTAILIVYTIMNRDSSNDNAKVRDQLAKLCVLQVPKELKGKEWESVLGGSQQKYVFDNIASKDELPSFQLVVVYHRLTMFLNKQAVISNIRAAFAPDAQEDSDRLLKWNIDGEEINVLKRVFQVPIKTDLGDEPQAPLEKVRAKNQQSVSEDNQSREHQTIKHYCGVVVRDTGVYGIAICGNDSLRPITDQEVRKIFESFKPLDPAVTDE